MFSRFFAIAVLLCAASASALEIPLQRGASSKSRGGVTVGFVDMERIYKDFPETQKARKEYQLQADKLKQALSDKEAELSDLREQLSVLKAASQELPVMKSSVTVKGAPPAEDPAEAIAGSLSDKQRLLAQEEDSLSRSRKEAAQALAEFERRRAGQIFGKLYKSLIQLAEEKGIDLIVDKQSLLYGQEALDLTEALSRRVRGLPEQEDPE